MTEILITHDFFDKDDHRVCYKAGAKVSFDDVRADNIVSLGLALKIEPAAKEVKPETEDGTAADGLFEMAEDKPAKSDKPKGKRK